jgi:hypothetical protein
MSGVSSNHPKLIAGFIVVALVAGAAGYGINALQNSTTQSLAQASSPSASATNMLKALTQANWSPASFGPYQTPDLKTWLSNPENQKALSESLANIGTLKGNIQVKEVRTESRDGFEGGFVVLTADFTKGTQFINFSMLKQNGDWKLNNVSVVSQDRVFAERTYVIGAQVLNQLSQNSWSIDTLKQYASADLKNSENDPKTKAALSALADLGTVNKVNEMLKFTYDGKTKTADILMDVEFSKAHRPVLMIMTLNQDHWELNGLSVMNYEAAKPSASNASAPSAKK